MSDLLHVKGFADLQRFMDSLAPKMEQNVMRGALRAGAKYVLLPAAQRGTHSVSGELSKSLRVSVRASRGTVRAAVKTDLFYGPLVEYRTRAHWITSRDGKALSIGGVFFTKAVFHPGTAGKPFMRPALDNNAQRALAAVGEYVKARLATKHGLDTSGVTIGIEEG